MASASNEKKVQKSWCSPISLGIRGQPVRNKIFRTKYTIILNQMNHNYQNLRTNANYMWNILFLNSDTNFWLQTMQIVEDRQRKKNNII